MGVNLLFINIVPGTPQSIPAGFMIASISPSSGASYTITNSLPAGISGVSSQSSPAITITASAGNVLVAYVSGV